MDKKWVLCTLVVMTMALGWVCVATNTGAIETQWDVSWKFFKSTLKKAGVAVSDKRF